MFENRILSIRQFTILVLLSTVGDAILVLPTITATAAHRDAWISAVIGVTIGLLIVYIISAVGNLYPQLTLVQSTQKILGTWVGSLVATLVLLYFLLVSVAIFREIGDFIRIELLQGTPIQAIQILFGSVVIMAVRLGIEVIGRFGELFLPAIVITLFILFIAVVPQAQMINLQPILENGIHPVLLGSISFVSFPFMELVIMLMLVPNLSQTNKFRTGLFKGALMGGIILIILIFVSILVIGADAIVRGVYPSYYLAKRISIGHFFERIEVLLAFIWLLTTFIKLSLYFYAFNFGLAQLLNLKEYRMLTLPSGMLMLVLSAIIAPNIAYYNKVLANYWPYFDMTYGLLLPLILLAVHYIRKKFKKSTST
ncbi:GerAB/ArcD/ProY family transporter [Paenibacillus sp. CMAA1364]